MNVLSECCERLPWDGISTKIFKNKGSSYSKVLSRSRCATDVHRAYAEPCKRHRRQFALYSTYVTQHINDNRPQSLRKCPTSSIPGNNQVPIIPIAKSTSRDHRPRSPTEGNDPETQVSPAWKCGVPLLVDLL